MREKSPREKSTKDYIQIDCERRVPEKKEFQRRNEREESQSEEFQRLQIGREESHREEFQKLQIVKT